MTVTYPQDAVVPVSAYAALPGVSSREYNDTNNQTTFVLATPVSHRYEVVAVSDGIIQNIDSYYLVNNSNSITFYLAPNATNLVLYSIRVPSNLLTLRSFPTVRGVEYTGNSSTTVWNLPDNTNPSAKDEILVSIDGVVQSKDIFSLNTDNNQITITSAIPTGSNLQIRVFDTNPVSLLDRFNTMEDKKPDKGFGTSFQLQSVSFESQAGYEKRRLMSRRTLRTWDLSYTNVHGVLRLALEEFYKNRFGTFESFFFDLTHLAQETGQATVRFDSPLNVQQTAVIGLNPSIDAYYNVSFKLKEVYD